jgi:hypothetical protein
MSTLAARKSRTRTVTDEVSVSRERNREEAISPTRKKEITKTKTTSNATRLIVGSLLLLVFDYFYRNDGKSYIDPTPVVNTDVGAITATNVPKSVTTTAKSTSLRFVTIVMPSVVNPKRRRRRLEAIAETWGPTSRSIYVIHNLEEEYPNPALGVDQWPRVLQVPPNITVDEGLPRLYYVIRQVFQDYNADFYFFANDHTYIIPEHMCYFLRDQDPSQDLYAGHALKNDHEAFNSGAAGYVLSRNTMKRLVLSFDAVHDSNCVVPGDNKWLQGNPGLVTARCLHHSLNVKAIDTRENGKYHRFHAFGLVRSATGKVDDWYKNKHANLRDIIGFDESYTHLLSGEDCCSAETISFHYVEFLENRALYQIRKALLQKPQLSDDELKNMMIDTWPKDWGELGGYSRALPERKKEPEVWAAILAILRKLSLKEYEQPC